MVPRCFEKSPIARETAAGGANTNNLPAVAVQRGVTTAVGFEENIHTVYADHWTQKFLAELENGATVTEAAETAKGYASTEGPKKIFDCTYQESGIESCIIFGNPNTKLND